MKVEKRSNGCYRVRKRYKGDIYTINFDHEPDEKEVVTAIAKKLEDNNIYIGGTFEAKAKEYINLKSNILSPSTIGGYEKILRQITDEFKNKKIADIDQTMIQKELNYYAVGHAPKSVKNMSGFITAVFGLYRPNMAIRVTLPQAVKYEPYLPKSKEIKAILKAVKGTDYSIPFQLGVLGLRRSEVCAATIDDLNGNYLKINKAYIYDQNNKPMIKNLTKSTEGKREIYLPDSLVEEIKQKGYIFNKQPHNLVRVLHEKQNELHILEFRFHDLRHFYASYAHEHGMPDADIMASGGWASDYTMKRTYRHAMEAETKKRQQKIANSII